MDQWAIKIYDIYGLYVSMLNTCSKLITLNKYTYNTHLRRSHKQSLKIRQSYPYEMGLVHDLLIELFSKNYYCTSEEAKPP